MAFLSSMNIAASGMTAQQLRLDVVAENITNSTTTRTENGEGPYRRKMVVFEAVSGRETFQEAMARANGKLSNEGYENAGGVRVTQIAEDPSDFKIMYDPTHPDADERGYVEMPNVELLQETVDAMSASRSYEANVTALNAIKLMASKALEVGK